MKKSLKDFTLIVICFFTLIFLFLNNELINNNIIVAFNLWITKIFPSLFPMFILNELLIVANFPIILLKLFKQKGLKYYTFIMSLLSGSPSSAYLIKNLLTNNLIETKTGNQYLTFTYFANPLFLYTMLFFIFKNKYLVFKIIFCHYLANFIISLFFRDKKTNSQQPKMEKLALTKIINKSLNTLLMILGTITFYIIITTILTQIFKFNALFSSCLKGFLEITQGLNSLTNLNINLKLKEILALTYISFGGLSIHTQIKSIITDTSLNYHYFFWGRISQTVLSILLITFVNTFT